MIVQPKIRGFICTTAHPVGCAAHITEWVDYVKQHGQLAAAPKKVLVIGASTGFGLASRITAAFGGGAKTIGVFFEKPASGKRTASAGWYNTATFERLAAESGLYAKSINGDAFSNEIKQQTIELIQKDWDGQVDLVIYSIASPRRIHPDTEQVFSSTLKPIGQSFHDKTVDVHRALVSDVQLEPASEDEIAQTVAVMGGEDWRMWMDRLLEADLLAPKAKSVAFTYIGPELTHDIYRNGTIGRAKEDLEAAAHDISQQMQKAVGGEALISVNKALVTQASAAIPVVPLYISLLYKIMKAKSLHEGCIEQMHRLFFDRLYGSETTRDEKGRIRIDDWEMRDDVQQAVQELWGNINTENLKSETDLQGYLDDFYRLFGYGIEHIDYQQDVEVTIPIPSLEGSNPMSAR